jgi:hypothetical protein
MEDLWSKQREADLEFGTAPNGKERKKPGKIFCK